MSLLYVLRFNLNNENSQYGKCKRLKSPENTENEVDSPAISTVVLKKKECIIETREGEKQNELRETKASVVSRLRGCDNRLLCDTNFIIIIIFKPFTP